MRENQGRPDDAIAPTLTLPGDDQPIGHVITVISKSTPYSKLPELRQIAKHTHDPAQRRDKALQFFSETYYQKAKEFSDTLTATFPPESPGAASILEAGSCVLTFEAYGQRYDLTCTVRQLEQRSALYQSTWWHNMLFNPDLPADTVILGFTPDWQQSSADEAN